MDNFDNMPSSSGSEKQSSIFKLPLSSILKNSESVVFVTDESYKIVWLNESVFDSIFNAPEIKSFIINKPITFFANYIQELLANPRTFMQWITSMLNKRQPIYEKEIILKSGERLLFSNIPITHEGRFSGVIWQAKKQDIQYPQVSSTESRIDEREFLDISKRFNIKCCRIDNDGNIISATPSFYNFTGYNREKLLGTNILDCCFSGKEQLDRCLKNRASILLNKNDCTIELEFIHNNDIRWVKCNIYFDFFTDEKDSKNHAFFLTDITMQKDTQRELEVAKEKAELNRLAQQHFLASMSHDIRTPLNAIIGMILLMADTEMSEEQQEYFKVLKNASNILLDMLNSILNFAKIESGKQKVNVNEFDLPDLLHALIATFSFKLKDKNVDILYEVDPDINYYVIGDKVLLNQVLMNLLTNAKKFTQKGEIKLTARVDRVLNSSIWIEFKVKDTGIGISEENMKKIFHDFITTENDLQINYGSFGLGLFICKKLVELMGGKVSMDSKEGQGTTFTFSLPFRKTNKQLPKIEIEPVPKYKATGNLLGKILVVEDNYMNLKYLSKLLEKYKIEFDVALDGLETLEMIKDNYYDLILLDMKLPKMDGLEVTSHIRKKQNSNTATPIILVSAATAEDTMEISKKAGVNDLLPKPYTPQQLLNILKKYLVDKEQNVRAKNLDESAFKFNQKLDVDYLQKLYSGNSDYAMVLFKTFIEWADHDWSEVQELIEGKNWKALKDLVHKIKPNFSMVGLTWITEMMQKAYDQLKEENYDLALDSLKKVQADFKQNMPLIKEEYHRLNQYLLPEGG